MKTLVVYDSMYGFTEKIAKAIGSGIAGEIKVVRFSDVKAGEVAGCDLLVVGSPTQGGRALKSIQEWVESLLETDIKNKKTAVFDTRIPAKWVKLFGYASGKIGDSLKKKGANLIVQPEGFLVKGAKGPLSDGEEERAGEWGKKLAGGV
jgi:flavodoxin